MIQGTMILCGRLEELDGRGYVTDGQKAIAISIQKEPEVVGQLIAGFPICIKGELEGPVIKAERIVCLI